MPQPALPYSYSTPIVSPDASPHPQTSISIPTAASRTIATPLAATGSENAWYHPTLESDCESKTSTAPSPTTCAAMPLNDFPTNFLADIVCKSCSRNNFCANLVRAVFSAQVRRCSNVSGKLGKKQLDIKKMKAVRTAAFQMFPCSAGEKEDQIWAQCIKSIDESYR